MQPNQPNNFGAIERTPNVSDYPLGAFTLSSYPATFQTDISHVIVENQQKIPACGAHAGSYLKDIQDVTRTSPEYLWKRIKQIDNYPPERGTDMLSILKTLQTRGVCGASLLPNNTSLDLATYTDPSTITMPMDADAQDHRIDTYAFQFNPTMDDIKRAIYTHGAVIALLKVDSNWWLPAWNALQMPLDPPTNVVSGHFIILYGYGQNLLYGLNEWSDQWGVKGTFTIDASYLPFITEIGTAVDTSFGRFQRDMGQGAIGLDVYSLQKYLVSHGFGTYTPTGFYGSLTAASVKLFQRTYGIQQTGFVGPITRGKLNILYAQTM